MTGLKTESLSAIAPRAERLRGFLISHYKEKLKKYLKKFGGKKKKH